MQRYTCRYDYFDSVLHGASLFRCALSSPARRRNSDTLTPSFFAARSQRLRSASVLRITVTRVFMMLPSRCIYDNYKPDSPPVYTQSDERLFSFMNFRNLQTSPDPNRNLPSLNRIVLKYRPLPTGICIEYSRTSLVVCFVLYPWASHHATKARILSIVINSGPDGCDNCRIFRPLIFMA